MPELEEQLTALAAEIAWPATPPHLWGGAGRSPAERRWAWPGRWQSRWALAAAAVLLILGMLLAYTPTRNAIADWVNVHTIFHRTEKPLPSPSLPPPSSGSLGNRLSLGDPTTLEAAQSQVGWKIQVPSSLGRPDEVYVKLPPSGPSGGMVTLVYAQRPDIKTSGLTGVSVLVTEARGRVDERYFEKTMGPDVNIEQVTVNGHSGYWISGTPHGFAFVAANGEPYFDTLRLATNTLILDEGGFVLRIEGDLTKDQAIQIARSLS